MVKRGFAKTGVVMAAMLGLTVLFGTGCVSGPLEDPRNFGPAGPIGMTGPQGPQGPQDPQDRWARKVPVVRSARRA